MTKTPIEALAATIADFKANPAMRTTTYLARDQGGYPCAPSDAQAVCFCALGRYAYHRGHRDLSVYDAVDMDFELGPDISSPDIYGANDADASPDGSNIIPHLERLLADLQASTETPAAA